MSGRGKDRELEDQQHALSSYLDALLQEVPDDYPEEILETPVHAAPVVSLVPAIQQEIELPRWQPQIVAAPAETPTETLEVQVEQVADERKAGVPEWAREPFQCLLFNVVGISLAVPLSKLNGVIPWSGQVTPMPGHSPMFLGLLRRLEQNIKVIDTAQMILPGNMQDTVLAPVEERIRSVLIMDEGRWGLACDGVGEVVTLGPDDVRWRTAQGKRPWLAGTVLQHMCALLDTDAFTGLLEKGFDE